MNRSKPIAAYLLAGALIAYLAWGFHPALMPLTLLLPLLYGRTKRRIEAFVLMAGYFLTAARGLPQGVANFFASDYIAGIILWFAAALGFVFVYTVLWHKNPKRRAVGFLIGLIIMSVPPFGIMGWVSPLTSTGIILPKTGFIGLALVFGFIYFIQVSHQKTQYVLCGAVALSCLNMAFIPLKESPEGWKAENLSIPFNTGEDNLTAKLTITVEVEKRMVALAKIPQVRCS